MTEILDFLADWHIVLIIITVVLIFALIGYFVEQHRHKASPFKIASDRNKVEKINVDKLKTMDSSVSLSDALSKNVTIKNNNPNLNSENQNKN